MEGYTTGDINAARGTAPVGRIPPKQKADLFWVFEAAVVRCSMLCHVAVPKLRMLSGIQQQLDPVQAELEGLN
jgi:hypothetical protein